jgi:hypothetical protein
MSKRDAFYQSLDADDEGQIQWPRQEAERPRWIRALFGAETMRSRDAVTAELLDKVEGRWPKPGSMEYETEIVVANVFRSMSDEQRGAVRDLLLDATRLTLASFFLGLEHFPVGRVDIRVMPSGSTTDKSYSVLSKREEWQQLLLDWEESYGDSTEANV